MTKPFTNRICVPTALAGVGGGFRGGFGRRWYPTNEDLDRYESTD